MTDAFPNYMSGLLSLSAANTFTAQTNEFPVNRLRVSGAKATVIEILWIDIALATIDMAAAGDAAEISFKTGPLPTDLQNYDNPDVFAFWGQEVHFVTSGMALESLVYRIDLQSNDGHGQLIAADRFHIGAQTAGMAGATNFRWRLYYRFVNVPITEFIGIVQSQS